MTTEPLMGTGSIGKAIAPFYQSGVRVSRASDNDAGDATSQPIITITLPPLRANDAVRVEFAATYPNSASLKALAIKLGGTTIKEISGLTATNVSTNVQGGFVNRGATNSQVSLNASGSISIPGSSGSALATASIETNAGATLTIEGRWAAAVAGESIHIDAVIVTVLRGA